MNSYPTTAGGRTALLAAATVLAAACSSDPIAAPRLAADRPALAVSATVAAAPEPAAEPRVFLNTTYPAQTGRTLHVPATGIIQQAIDSARLGDVITLEPGVTYRQYVLLRAKPSGTGWIVIRTATPDGVLPPAGTRIQPADAPKMARIIAPKGPAIRTMAGTHHYRLVGLEVGLDPALASAGLVISLGEAGPAQDLASEIPHDIVLDRVWVHANPTTPVLRCIGLNSAYTALIDSYVSECHHPTSDSQSAGGTNGPGPFKIVNNYLEGAGEVVMFGGADPVIANLVPSDIEIRNNHITRPTAWKDKWLVKNLLEIKNGQRILVEGNVLENNWQDGQSGTAVVLKSVNQSGRCTWCVTRDVTLRYNLIRRTPAGIAISSNPERYPAVPASHMQFSHNVLELSDPDPLFSAGSRRSIIITGALTDIGFDHNTVIDAPSDMLYVESGATPMKRIAYTNNVAFLGTYGIHGSSVVSGQATLDKYAPGAIVVGNVMIGSTGGRAYPAGNFFPATAADVRFVAFSTGGYQLASTSPYLGKGTDGRDPGADIPALAAAVRGVTDLGATVGSVPPPAPEPAPAPAPAPAPSPTPTADGPLKNAAGGCLASSSADATVSTWLTILTCADAPRQTWTVPALGTAGPVKLAGGLCLNASGGKVGSVAFVGTCDPAAPSQQWTLTAAGELRSYVGACVASVTKSWGKRAELVTCTGAAAQLWTR